MPKLEPFKHLAKTRKKVESLHPLSPSLPAETTHVVHQPQPRSSDIHMSTDNAPDPSLKMTETISTLTPANGITNDRKRTPSALTIEHVSHVSDIHHPPSTMTDTQQSSSHSLLSDMPETFIAQVSCRPHTLELPTRINTKQRRHQHRLCYKCRQTGHLQTHCPRLTEHEN